MQIYISKSYIDCFEILWKMVPKSTCEKHLSWFQGKRALDLRMVILFSLSVLTSTATTKFLFWAYVSRVLWWIAMLGSAFRFWYYFLRAHFGGLKKENQKKTSVLSRLSRKLNNYVWHFLSLQLLMAGGVFCSLAWGLCYIPKCLLPSAVL